MGILNVVPPGLLRTKLFDGLEQGELKALVNKGELKTFKEGDEIIKEGDQGDTFYFVVKGAIDIFLKSSTQPVKIAMLGEASVLGEMVLVKKNVRTATALAAKDSELICWHYSQCLDLFNTNPILGYKVMRNLACLVTDKLTDMNAVYKDK